MASVACQLLVCWLVAANVTGFAGTVWDKAQARRGGQRVPEWTFHIASLLGAWVGILVGMVTARHKIRKTNFLGWFLFGVFLDAFILLTFVLQWCAPDLS